MTEQVESLKAKPKSTKPVDKSVETVDKSKPQKSKRGGVRPGSGRKKGKLEPQTIEKMKIKTEMERRIARNADRLLNAQMTVALGAQYLIKRTKVPYKRNGKTYYRWGNYQRVTDPDEMLGYLDGAFKDSEDQYYMLTAEKPDVKAIDSMLDRAFGRAPQNLKIQDDRRDPITIILAKFGLLPDEGESDNAGQAPGAQGAPPKSLS